VAEINRLDSIETGIGVFSVKVCGKAASLFKPLTDDTGMVMSVNTVVIWTYPRWRPPSFA
jgi:hypothetical protein